VLPKVLSETGHALDDSKLIITIAAGVSISTITGRSEKPLRVVRAMPNVNVLVAEGASAITASQHASETDYQMAATIFKSVGRCVTVQNESLMDAVTGLSGSGPAYVFVMIEALADAGVKMGLTREQALQLSAQTLLGAAKLHLETGKHPGQLKDMVTSPGGTTIAGLHALERGSLRSTLMDAVESATLKSLELGAAAGKQ
jgi:pyrroline-5-carboxylate reductase